MTSKKKPLKKTAAPVAKGGVAASTANTLVRAIRVTPDILAAAKAYKKATGKSFYALGREAISERLEREGYLKAAEAGVGA